MQEVWMQLCSTPMLNQHPLCRYLWRQNYNLSITQVYSQINDPIVQSSNLQQLSYDINGPYADPDDFVDYLTTCEALTTPLPSPEIVQYISTKASICMLICKQCTL